MMNILCGTVVVGGGYYDVFDLSSYKLLSGWQQCGSSASAAAQRCWQRGGGGSRAVAARQQQRDDGSKAVVAVRWQRGGGQRGGGVGSAAAAALAACWRGPTWRLRWKFGSIAASAAAAERWELRCRRTLPRWQ